MIERPSRDATSSELLRVRRKAAARLAWAAVIDRAVAAGGFDSRSSTSTSQYLFRPHMSAVYLCLGQGTSKLKAAFGPAVASRHMEHVGQLAVKQAGAPAGGLARAVALERAHIGSSCDMESTRSVAGRQQRVRHRAAHGRRSRRGDRQWSWPQPARRWATRARRRGGRDPAATAPQLLGRRRYARRRDRRRAIIWRTRSGC